MVPKGAVAKPGPVRVVALVEEVVVLAVLCRSGKRGTCIDRNGLPGPPHTNPPQEALESQ